MLGRLVLQDDHDKLLGNVVVLAYLNSLINPCLYMIINRDVRAALENFFCRFRNNQVDQVWQEMSSSSLSMKRIKKTFSPQQDYSPASTKYET